MIQPDQNHKWLPTKDNFPQFWTHHLNKSLPGILAPIKHCRVIKEPPKPACLSTSEHQFPPSHSFHSHSLETVRVDPSSTSWDQLETTNWEMSLPPSLHSDTSFLPWQPGEGRVTVLASLVSKTQREGQKYWGRGRRQEMDILPLPFLKLLPFGVTWEVPS